MRAPARRSPPTARSARISSDRTRRRRELLRRLPQLKAEIERLVGRICKATDSAVSNARLMALDGTGGERERFEAELAALEAAEGPVALRPSALDAYRRAVDEPRETLEGERRPRPWRCCAA